MSNIIINGEVYEGVESITVKTTTEDEFATYLNGENFNKLKSIRDDGDGTKFLSDKGDYKEPPVSYTKGLSYTPTGANTCSVSGKGVTDAKIIIPSCVFDGETQYVVTSIKEAGFQNNKNIQTVIIPETITSIDNNAFENCTSLVNIKIPSSVVTLGSNAFGNCTSLEEVELPDSITSIIISSNLPRYLFGGCKNLKKVVLGKGISVLPYQCFLDCENLTEIIIKGEVTPSLTQAFNGVNENATLWVKNVAAFKTYLGAGSTISVKSYRDILELNEKVEEFSSGGGNGGSSGTTVTVNGETVETFNADTKLDAYSGPNAVSNLIYTRLANGTNGTIIGSYNPMSGAIPLYSNDGTVSTNAPTSPKHCANKDYVDEKTALYQHEVKFAFYNINDMSNPINSGTLIIPSKSAILIDNVEELRKYVGSLLFASNDTSLGFSRIESYEDTYGDVLSVKIGDWGTAMIYTGAPFESTTLTDIVTEVKGA